MGGSWRNDGGAEAGQVATGWCRVSLPVQEPAHYPTPCLMGKSSCNSLTWSLVLAGLP